MTGDSSRWSWIYLKAEAARSKCEEDGASDIEAIFASAEAAKPPNILAAEASGDSSFPQVPITSSPIR
ncbi:hypothetical protein COC96_25520 [Bacillus cereus]|nr:hypothetical protein COC96_25520 [Bacillus cereus]